MSQKQPKISVIMPVYNVEAYLRESLDSVINQTLQDIEIIVVNDGATDSSPKIAEEYAKKDSRIKIVNKVNGGLSSARNAGLPYVTGEYIHFFDSDDLIDVTMYEKLYNANITEQAEIVCCAIARFEDDPKKLKPFFSTQTCINNNGSSPIFKTDAQKKSLMYMKVCWNKLFKTDFFFENKYDFPEGLIFEDNPLLYASYIKAKKILLHPEQLYLYRLRNDSIITKKGKVLFDVFKIYEIILNQHRGTTYYHKFADIIINSMVNDLYYRYTLIQDEFKKEFLEKASSVINSLDKEEIKYITPYTYPKYLIFKHKMHLLASRMSPVFNFMGRIRFMLQNRK